MNENDRQPTPPEPVHPAETHRERFVRELDDLGGYRALEERYGVSRGTLWRIIEHGRFPKSDQLRCKLGLPLYGGLTERKCKKCTLTFQPNHPNRIYCYACSPIRPRSKRMRPMSVEPVKEHNPMTAPQLLRQTPLDELTQALATYKEKYESCLEMLDTCRKAIAALEEWDLGEVKDGEYAYWPVRDELLYRLDQILNA